MKAKHVFMSKQFVSDYQCKADFLFGRSYCSLEEILPRQSQRIIALRKTKPHSRKRKKDKWSWGKSVLVWRGPLKSANQEDRPEIMNPWLAIHTLIYLLEGGVNRCFLVHVLFWDGEGVHLCWSVAHTHQRSFKMLLWLSFEKHYISIKGKASINLQSCVGLASVSP